MRGYAGLQTLTGGVSPWSPVPNPRPSEGDGGQRRPPLPGERHHHRHLRGPRLRSRPASRPPQLGGGVAVPSYYINVQVTSQNPNTSSDVTVSQATYVSPN